MVIFAIDPGNENSAFAVMTDESSGKDYALLDFDKLPNKNVMQIMLEYLNRKRLYMPDKIVIERMMSYSTNVGQTTFITCEWIGRFSQEAEKVVPVEYIFRKDEKMYLCETMKANDTMIRHALIDRFATFDKQRGTGTKKNPDYFYGVTKDCWSAIAIATTFLDMQKEKKNA